MFLNVVFTLLKFLIEFGLNPALTVVCLFIYILFVCLFTYFISITSWSLKLEQILECITVQCIYLLTFKYYKPRGRVARVHSILILQSIPSSPYPYMGR